MPMRDDRFEELLAAMTGALTAYQPSLDTTTARLLATVALKGMLNAGFVPLKSIQQLMDDFA